MTSVRANGAYSNALKLRKSIVSPKLFKRSRNYV